MNMAKAQTDTAQTETGEGQEEKPQQQPTEEPKVKQVTFLETEDGKPEERPKKVRKRTKGIMNQLRSQMEFYFGDANLNKDRFMKQRLDNDPEGYIPISDFLNFNQIKVISTEENLLVKALKLSKMLQVSEDGSKVRRTSPVKYFTQEEIDARTVYVEGFHKFTSRDWIVQKFSKCGKVTYVSLPRFKTTKEIKGYAFVEFETPEEAARAVKKLNCVPDKLAEKPGDKVSASVKQSKNLTHWKKRATKEGIDPADAEASSKEGGKQGGEEDGSKKEGTKTKSRKKKKKNRSSISQGEASATDSSGLQKPNITSSKSAKDESKENTLKPDASNEADDTKVKKSKKSKKKRKRKSVLHKQTSEDTTSAVSQKTGEAESTVADEKKSEETGESGSTAVDKTKKHEESEQSGDQGSRKRRRPTEEMSDHNSAKVPKVDLGEGSEETGEKEDVKKPGKDDSVFQEDSKPISELPHLSTGGEESKSRDSESEKSSHKKERKQVNDNSEDTDQKNIQSATDTTSEGAGAAKLSETQKSSSKKRKSDSADASQEKSSKAKKQKENKQRRQSRKSIEQGPETAPGEGRKRKRKSLEGGDDGSSRKKKRLSAGTDAEAVSEADEQEGKTKRHRRHKPPEPTIRLRVMTKAKWTNLKKEYLGQQKVSMRKLKEQLRETALKKKEQAKNQQNNGQDEAAEEVKGSRPAPEFVPNVLLEVRSDGALCLQTIKADIPPAVQVAYVDIRPGMTDGYIRCSDAASASQLLKNGLRGLTLSRVEGDAELQYWNKVVTDRQVKLSDTKRRKRRGKLKILQRAQNPHEEATQRQHLIFADSDAEGTMDPSRALDEMQDDFNAYSNMPSAPSSGDTQDEQFEVPYG